jgi:2-polyprenyl-3-methyl-5-hydroxy-6-metoxy-1,4-benzoquinol methylase
MTGISTEGQTTLPFVIPQDFGISPEQQNVIETLLAESPHAPAVTQEDIWFLMDRTWDRLDCDHNHPTRPNITAFYRHPVWILNGLFIEQDPVSMGHRHAICDWLVKRFGNRIDCRILDYGGGFGTMARLVAEANAAWKIDIFDPHPSDSAVRKSAAFPGIRFVRDVKNVYDGLLCIDVLEHVPDPIRTLSQMVRRVRPGGYLLIANFFHPVIKCHLPQTFHLRYTFVVFCYLLGLRYLGSCPGSHAAIYRKTRNRPFPARNRLTAATRVSRGVYPLLNVLHRLYNTL